MSEYQRPVVAVLVAGVLAVGLVGCSDSDRAVSAASAPAKEDPGLVRRSPAWAAADKAVLTPGIQTYTQGAGQCTTNFVFTDSAGTVYIGQSAHCAGKGESEETNGCKTSSLPLGTRVTFNEGGSPFASGRVLARGTLAYSSWLTMRKRAETDANTCAYNDFALIKIAVKDRDLVNPTVPSWGGPVGISDGKISPGDTVFSYGNSSLRGGLSKSAQKGTVEGDHEHWGYDVHSITPGIPGDSGSAYLDPNGKALGTLSTLGLSIPIRNTVGDLRRELEYARAHSGIHDLRLELGTTRFQATR